MKIEVAIEKIFELTGTPKGAVPAVAKIFRAAGAPETVPDGTLKRVLQAGRELKAQGVK